MAKTRNNPAPATPEKPEMEYCLRPASDWLREVESTIEALSVKRDELRRQIHIETAQRHLVNPYGESPLGVQTARELAKNEVLGADWKHAQELLRHARQSVISARRQLSNLDVHPRAQKEVVRWSRSWFWWKPFQMWRARPLRRRLNKANTQRRAALVNIRAFRANLVSPEVCSRIFNLSERILLREEKLSCSIQSLREIEKKVSGTLSEALQLAPRLRGLGGDMVPMHRYQNSELRLKNLPVPVGPLCAPKSDIKKSSSLRIH